jgi:hypothetical protein
MKRSRYVILSSDGAGWDISREIDKPIGELMSLPRFGDPKYQDLLDLLGQGGTRFGRPGEFGRPRVTAAGAGRYTRGAAYSLFPARTRGDPRCARNGPAGRVG